MSSILIQDLVHSTALDSRAMSAVRGGSAWGAGHQRQRDARPADRAVPADWRQRPQQQRRDRRRFRRAERGRGRHAVGDEPGRGAEVLMPACLAAASPAIFRWPVSARAAVSGRMAPRGQRIVDFSSGRAGGPWPDAPRRSAARPPSK